MIGPSKVIRQFFRISFPATLEGNKGKIVQKTVHIPQYLNKHVSDFYCE